MGNLVITGPDGKKFPSNCEVRVISMPGWEILFEGENISGTAVIPADPGKYRYIVRKLGKKGHISYVQHGEVLHECTEEQWKKLSEYEPKMAKIRQISEGARWFCGYFGCSESHSSRIAAIDHEAAHFGHSLLEHIDEVDEAQTKAEERAVAQNRAKEDAKLRNSPAPIAAR